HPKPLVDLCIDLVVQATVCYQRYCRDDEAVWYDVDQVWADLWYLPPCVPARAAHLLHAHLLHAHILHDRLECYVYDITRPLLTLLAARARRIAIVPVDRQFASLSTPAVFSECGVYKREHLLH
ncbi:hypothetical protein OTU49_012344, partial [Cherax quadricarinatus]